MNKSKNHLDASPAILIVDDNAVDRSSIASACSRLEYEIDTAASGEEALRKYKENKYRLVITDYNMQPMSGLELVQELRAIDADVECIIVTGSTSPEVMAYVQSNELSPVISKPITPRNLMNRAILSLERNRGAKEVVGEIALTNRMDTCLPLIGSSPACLHLRAEVASLLNTSEPILIYGPAGSGKPQVASFIHQQGSYGHSVCLECFCARESPDELAHSLIAPDGTYGDMIELTKNGTLILHNIEALPMNLQQVFAQEFKRIAKCTHIIVLSDGCLDSYVAEGLIDEQLYFEISLNTMQVPSIASREQDIPEMVKFMVRSSQTYGLACHLNAQDIHEFISRYNEGEAFTKIESLIFSLRNFSERKRVSSLKAATA